jgi:uncharacterized membrane protein YfcA
MARCKDVSVAERPSFWFRSWRERTAIDWVPIALIVAGGWAFGAILPRWLWNMFVVIVLVTGYYTLWRRKRRRGRQAGPMPPEYRGPADGGSSQ